MCPVLPVSLCCVLCVLRSVSCVASVSVLCFVCLRSVSCVASVSVLCFVCLCSVSCVPDVLFIFVLCVVYPMLPVSLDGPFGFL